MNCGFSKINRIQNERDKVFYYGYQSNTDKISLRLVPGFKNGDENKIFLCVGTFGESYELELIVKEST
jgi:hypothetical protein